VAQDVPVLKAWGEVTADLLKRLGMKVDYAALDWGTVFARHLQKSPPAQGGWNVWHTWLAGAACADPAAYNLLRANPDTGIPGWANSPLVEAEIAAWYEAKTLDDEKVIMRRLNKAALDHVVTAPLGFYLGYQAWRKNVTGIVKGPMPFFWGVSKTV
jgi:peptide/nickel transport system substrate-binding protein